MHFAFSFGAQAAEVEVDTRTGEVQVLQVIAANDVGRALNPMGLQGQVEGGVMMGLGNALTENFIVQDGYVITDRLARYRVPSIQHTPEIVSIVVEDPPRRSIWSQGVASSPAFQPRLPSRTPSQCCRRAHRQASGRPGIIASQLRLPSGQQMPMPGGLND
jgi:xanthine dehydrogenase molybdopterin-binding subunit B